MKKLVLSLSILLMSTLPTLAYYDNYSRSETSLFDVILWLIIMVFGILQIILFFKIWGMTNDIRMMKEKYVSPTQNKDVFLTYYGIKSLNGEEAAKKYIIGEIIKELSVCDTADLVDRDSYEKKFGKINKKYQHILNDAKVGFPDMSEYLDYLSPDEYEGYKIGDKVKVKDFYQECTISSFNVIKKTVIVKSEVGNYYTFKMSKIMKVE